MALSFPWPVSQGEWLAWSAAAVTVLFGLFIMFMPRLMLRLFGLQVVTERAEALVVPRAMMGGFHIGFGLTAILFAQPFIYMALGAAWGVAAFGSIISLLSDGARAFSSWVFFLISMALAILPLAFVLGFIV